MAFGTFKAAIHFNSKWLIRFLFVEAKKLIIISIVFGIDFSVAVTVDTPAHGQV